MKNPFKILALLCAITVPILALCPDRPTIPAVSPMLITKASPGISNFPSSTKELSVTLIATPNELCPTSSTFPLFSMSVQPPASSALEYLTVYIHCTNFNVFVESSWFATYSVSVGFTSTSVGPVAIFFSIDLNGNFRSDIQGGSARLGSFKTVTIATGPSFDSNTKIYLCAGKDGVSPKACTVSEFVLEYRFYGGRTWELGHLANSAAFYPLVDGSLESVIASTSSSAYFGDSPLNPTAGTSPAWDSSNNFVSISSGQFLTIPLPSLSSTIPTVSSSFTFAAWMKITSIPATSTTIFSMHSADGTQVGFQLLVAQSTNAVSLTFGGLPFSMDGANPFVVPDTWQLFGFSTHITTLKQHAMITVFVGTSWYQGWKYSFASDISTASVIRIGGATNSIGGQISAVRIMTPRGGVIRTSNLCSSKSSIELGVDSFALACSGSNILNFADSQCSSSCPSGTRSVITPSTAAFCLPCKSHCLLCDSTQCLTCEAAYALYKGECLSSCPDKTYSIGATCQSCPAPCTNCTSSTTCQACFAGYILSGSMCVTSTPPSSLQATAEASQTVGSALSVVGSAVSVGSSVLPIVGLVSEVVQNTRYLNLSVTEDLAEIYKTFSTNLIPWDLPNFLENIDNFKPLSELFARYDLNPSFVVNFWSTMMTVGVSLCVLVGCLGVKKLCFEKGKTGGLVYSLVRKIIAASINFIVVQAYGSLDNILFYFVLDARTNPLDTGFSRFSFALGIAFILGGSFLMIVSIRVIWRYHALKREGLAKNNMEELENHRKKNKYLEVFYGDFNDADVWSHCFLAFLVLRNNISSLVLTLFYAYPLMQISFLIVLDGGILLFMLIQKPFTTIRGVFFQYYFEMIVFIVHICTFILSWNDGSSETFKNGACKAIIYLNTALVTGGLGFMFIDLHETVREKIDEWKRKKADEKAARIALPDESRILFNQDSTIIETKFPKENLERDSSKNDGLHVPKVKILRREPRIEFISNKDIDLT